MTWKRVTGLHKFSAIAQPAIRLSVSFFHSVGRVKCSWSMNQMNRMESCRERLTDLFLRALVYLYSLILCDNEASSQTTELSCCTLSS